jgi:hypothetical protein
MPTPRPEMSVIFAAVEKPASKISRNISLSGARRHTWIEAVLPRLGEDLLAVQAASVVGDGDDDLAGLMAGRDPNVGGRILAQRDPLSGDSMPWSIELRTMCSSGSESSSAMVLSSSVSSPLASKTICLPARRARSRTRRAVFWNCSADGDHAHAGGDALHIGRDARELGEIALEPGIGDRLRVRGCGQ